MDSPTTPALSREPLPPRKKPSILNWVLKIAAVALLGIFLGGAWLAATSPAFDRVLMRFAERQHAMQEAATAPGSDEIRKAGSCSRATVMSPALRKDLRGKMGPRMRGNEAPADETSITCVTTPFATPPSCDALARTYVDAAHPTGPFRINVSKSTRGKPACIVDYDSSGAAIALTFDGGL